MHLQIFTNTNLHMEKCLSELKTYLKSGSKVNCSVAALSEILLSDVVIHQGCYLLEELQPEGFIAKPEQPFKPDKTIIDRAGYEHFYNHLHISDLLLKAKKRDLGLLLLGVIIADNLKYKLKAAFPHERFIISVSYNVLPIDEDDLRSDGLGIRVDNVSFNILPTDEDGPIETLRDCVVRFYAVREMEPPFYDDLEGFKYEAIGIISI